MSTELGNGVNRYRSTFIWGTDQWLVFTPNDSSPIDYRASEIGGLKRIKSRQNPAASGSGSAQTRYEYDTAGNLTLFEDYNGAKTCRLYDPLRNLEAIRNEGLLGGGNANSCLPLLQSGAALPPGARKISTDMHPEWNLPVRQAEPGRLTVSIYNGQPDPYNGNVPAACAPPSAKLPDGKPIVVLCQRLEWATSDADGSSSFGATIDPATPLRRWQWTYDAFGRKLTATDPVLNVTRWAYYGSSSNDYTAGDLATLTNAMQQVTRFLRYDKSGWPLESMDANGVVTAFTYDPRKRLSAVTTAGQTWRYSYWPTGLIKQVINPDATWTYYEHDDAHRLFRVSDSYGNSVKYVLDDASNLRREELSDPTGTLRRTLVRDFDALGRVQQLTGRE